MSEENKALDINSAVQEMLLPLETENKVTPTDGEAEPVEEAQVSETEEQEEAIDESQEVEAEEGDEAEDTTFEEGDTEEVEEEAPTLYKIKVDGVEEEVTLDEALNGHMRQKKFHRELNSLHQDRKSFEAEKAETKQLQDRFKQGLATLDKQLQVDEPNWDELRKTRSQEEFNAIYTDWSIRQDQRKKVQAEIDQITRRENEENVIKFNQHMKNEYDNMLQKIPEWKSEKVMNNERKEVIEYAKSVIGYTDDEIANAVDHRAIVTLRKAMKFDNLMKKKPNLVKKVKQAPKMVKAGTPRTKSEIVSSHNKAVRDKFLKNSNFDNAVEYLLNQKK